MQIDLPKLDTSNLLDRTYNILKEKIIRREFFANQKLSIPELAEQLGVSRTPIRDALNRLEMDGLITTISKVGTFVSGIEVNDVLDIMDTRLMLEYWAVERISSYSKDKIKLEISKMEQIIHESNLAIESLPLETYLERDYNMAFHVEFIKLGRNNRNVDIYRNIMNYRFLTEENSLISKEMITTAIQQHSIILLALKNGNIDELKALIKLHLDDSKDRLLDKINKNGGIV